METEAAPATCQEPTNFYLLAVALRSFFLVLATHLLAGEVDTTLACVPLTRRLSWWCRYYNPLNLSWRYYSMFAYRFIAHSWGTHQLALINHEEHPFLPPLPYIMGETVHPLRVRRLEMAGFLSSQGILTFSAAYQGALAIQYSISTEGIPYLPNMTVPLAMVGLFRVMASKWVASKIQVDAYPYPCLPASPASQDVQALQSHPFAQMSKSKTGLSPTSSRTLNSSKDPSSTYLPMIKWSKFLSSSSSSVSTSHRQPSPTPSSPSLTLSPIAAFNTEPSSSLPPFSPQSNSKSRLLSPINLSFRQALSLRLPSYPYTACPPSPPPHSPLSSQSCISPLLPILSHPYCFLTLPPQPSGSLPLASERLGTTESLPSTSARTYAASMLCTCACGAMPSSSSFVVCQVHPPFSTHSQPVDYKSNKFVVAGWIGVLFGLVTMSFLPYKVVAAYQLPHRLLQFSMQLFYQYIAVSEFVFHAYLLFQGPWALANRVLFFDHWTFKVQTVGFYSLLTFMLAIALIDFVKHGYYRTCA